MLCLKINFLPFLIKFLDILIDLGFDSGMVMGMVMADDENYPCLLNGSSGKSFLKCLQRSNNKIRVWEELIKGN